MGVLSNGRQGIQWTTCPKPDGYYGSGRNDGCSYLIGPLNVRHLVFVQLRENRLPALMRLSTMQYRQIPDSGYCT